MSLLSVRPPSSQGEREAGSARVSPAVFPSSRRARLLIARAFPLRKMGQRAEARQLAQQVLEMHRGGRRKGHTYGVACLILADCLRDEHEWAKAEPYYEKARAHISPDTGEYAALLGNTCLNLQSLGQFCEALEMSKQQTKLLLELYGPNHPEYATGMSVMASVHFKMKQIQPAIEYQRKAIEIDMNMFGPGHPNVTHGRQLLDVYEKALVDKSFANDCVSDHRMCNRCGRTGKSSSKTFGKCPHCKMHYFCSKACSDATDNGLQAHVALCVNAPDDIGGNDDQCRRCRKSGAAKRCGACKVPRYCSPDCAKADWPRHKKFGCRKK